MAEHFNQTRRFDHMGKLTLVARGQGYVMVRRPGAVPFVLCDKEWDELSDAAPDLVDSSSARTTEGE